MLLLCGQRLILLKYNANTMAEGELKILKDYILLQKWSQYGIWHGVKSWPLVAMSKNSATYFLKHSQINPGLVTLENGRNDGKAW